jgi:membrane protein implicated in regulation of membrane protease activity
VLSNWRPNEIVQLRLQTIGERKVEGMPTWSSFLARRMAPAMRTCVTTEERQSNLSEKLARAANLLRTRVDVELEGQNRDLLRSMNERTRLQLRLQATVEGLSVAAISYYVVGLFGYLIKGAHEKGAPVDVSLATALFVPVAVLAIWWVVRRVRQRYRRDGLNKRGTPAMRCRRFRTRRARSINRIEKRGGGKFRCAGSSCLAVSPDVSKAKCRMRRGVAMGVKGRACSSPSIAARKGCGMSRALLSLPTETSAVIAFPVACDSIFDKRAEV